ELALGKHRLDVLGEQQAVPAVDRPDRERGGLARRAEPGLLDPAEQPVGRLDAEPLAPGELVSHDGGHGPCMPSWARVEPLRREVLGTPALARARVLQPLVQAVVSVLPELDRLWLEHVAAPPLRARHLLAGQEPLELGL